MEEIVRWEPDGRLVTTGVVYSKWSLSSQHTSAAFQKAAARLLAD